MGKSYIPYDELFEGVQNAVTELKAVAAHLKTAGDYRSLVYKQGEEWADIEPQLTNAYEAVDGALDLVASKLAALAAEAENGFPYETGPRWDPAIKSVAIDADDDDDPGHAKLTATTARIVDAPFWGLEVGDNLRLKGCSNANNDGQYTVASVDTMGKWVRFSTTMAADADAETRLEITRVWKDSA